MSPRRRARPAEQRLRRLLVMLPWLMERGSVPVSEVAERFALTEDEVTADLELVSMCGLPPYVDELIDLFIDEGTVHMGVPRLFTRSLRLDAVEAFELVAAGRAAMDMPGADPAGPLGRGLAKLEAFLGVEPAAVTVDLERAPAVDDLAAAVERGERVRIRYWSGSTDTVSERTVLPRQVFADRGNWYVLADDDRSGERRTFRVDRIDEIEPTGECVEPDPTSLPPPGEWFRDADLERVTLRLAPAARWVVERYPVDEVRAEGDGGAGDPLVAVLPVASERWLARLVVRLGPHVEVLAPAWARSVGPSAAARIMAVYDRSSSRATSGDGPPATPGARS